MKKGDVRTDAIYNYICKYIDANGYPPSVREIGAEFNIKSTSTVHYYVEKLRNEGMISGGNGKKRAMSVSSFERQSANYVPLVGEVSAGQGRLAMQNVEGSFPVPSAIFGERDLFMLKVDGDSMINCGICDGDYVVVHSQSTADLREIVVVLWEDKATVKRLAAKSPNLVLHPENDSMADIVISGDENPSILGKVVGCIKRF